MDAWGRLQYILLMMRFSPWAGGLLFVLHSPTNFTHLPKESPSASSRSTALSNSSSTTLWGPPASGATYSWERNLNAWSNLTGSGTLLVRKLRLCASARRWASFLSTRVDETVTENQTKPNQELFPPITFFLSFLFFSVSRDL